MHIDNTLWPPQLNNPRTAPVPTIIQDATKHNKFAIRTKNTDLEYN